MTTIIVGKALPDFTAQATSGKQIKLSDYTGKNVVLYFYPRDNTPGCTVESENFRDAHTAFTKHNTVIIGISRDSLTSHEKFKGKFALPFELISDNEEVLCQLFGVMKDKNMYGKKVRGIDRSTFLIDGQGKLRHEWRGVKVPGHVDEVLQHIKSL
jgi:peroxiredoxin Q/BCP